MKKNLILGTLILCTIIAGFFIGSRYKHDYIAIMATTGATPIALERSVNTDFSLKVQGLVKQEYEFSGSALNALASTRLRTQEVAPDGKLVGTYAYIGIPVINILEGVAPKKPDNAAFNQPLDLVVTFTSTEGKKIDLSYGEIIYANDAQPVTLAFDRREIRSSKDPEKYDKNLNKENLKGLRLICPRDTNTARYLDNVVVVELREPAVDNNNLPKPQKDSKCESKSIVLIKDGKQSNAMFAGVQRDKKTNWFRIGHGRGFKDITSAEGYNLRSFLAKNISGCGKDQYYLFVACDGYRCLFSGWEIFDNKQGSSIIITDRINGKPSQGGYMLAPLEDYFVDRDVWGLSHIVVLDKL